MSASFTPVSQLIEQFRSIEVRVSIRNLTTQTDFKRRPESTVLEIYKTAINGSGVGSNMLTIEAPERCCSVQHQLLIRFTSLGHSTLATAKVESIEKVAPGIDMIKVALVQFETRELESLWGMLDLRQTQIHRFLAQSRGLPHA